MNKHDSKPIPFEPLAVTKRQACSMVASSKLVQRWLYWTTHAPSTEQGWLRIVRQGGRGTETIIDYASLKEAYYRFRNGEEPPLLPSERGAR